MFSCRAVRMDLCYVFCAVLRNNVDFSLRSQMGGGYVIAVHCTTIRSQCSWWWVCRCVGVDIGVSPQGHPPAARQQSVCCVGVV